MKRWLVGLAILVGTPTLAGGLADAKERVYEYANTAAQPAWTRTYCAPSSKKKATKKARQRLLYWNELGSQPALPGTYLFSREGELEYSKRYIGPSFSPRGYVEVERIEQRIRWRHRSSLRLVCILEAGEVGPQQYRLTVDPAGGRKRTGIWRKKCWDWIGARSGEVDESQIDVVCPHTIHFFLRPA